VGGYRVRTIKCQKPWAWEKRDWGKNWSWHKKTLVDLTNWQQTNREHRYKYPGDNGDDGRYLEGGGDNHKDRWNRSRYDTFMLLYFQALDITAEQKAWGCVHRHSRAVFTQWGWSLCSVSYTLLSSLESPRFSSLLWSLLHTPLLSGVSYTLLSPL
jgi:hypothetical protein